MAVIPSLDQVKHLVQTILGLHGEKPIALLEISRLWVHEELNRSFGSS
ncbi:MAG TPA: hypothetical protein VHE55_07745 [Fimbriimonadaceae bacterium]|nr:hypothetical protein [Fimbriimonadaceae bacterium]